jgi:hypothetical protein
MTPKNPHTRYGVCYLELLNARHVQGVNIKILLSTTVISGYVVRSRHCVHFRWGKFEHKPKYTGLSQLTFPIVLKCEYWHKFPVMLQLFPWKYDFIFILVDTSSMNVWKKITDWKEGGVKFLLYCCRNKMDSLITNIRNRKYTL